MNEQIPDIAAVSTPSSPANWPKIKKGFVICIAAFGAILVIDDQRRRLTGRRGGTVTVPETPAS